MSNNQQTNQVCQQHNKIAEYYCLDHRCKIDEPLCYMCVAFNHSNCQDNTIFDVEELQEKIQIVQNPSNYKQLEESMTKIIKEQERSLLKILKEAWQEKILQTNKDQQQSNIDIENLLSNKKEYKIVEKGNCLQIIRNNEETTMGDFELCKKRIEKIFEIFQKKIQRLDLKIPNRLSRHNFLRSKKELKYKQQKNDFNKAQIKTHNFYSTAMITSKFPWKNFILEFDLSDNNQKHSLGFIVQDYCQLESFYGQGKQIQFSLINNTKLGINLLDQYTTITKPVTSHIKGFFKDENQKVCLYLDGIDDAVFEVDYIGNLFFYFKADRHNVSLFINLIK